MNAVNFIPSDSSYGLLHTPRPGAVMPPMARQTSSTLNTMKPSRGSAVLRIAEDLAPSAQRVLNTTVHAWNTAPAPKASLR